MAADVKDLFLAAAALPEADRPGYLDRICGQDTVLRRRVEALLRAHDSPSDSPATGPYASVVGTSREEIAGTAIAGKYKLLECIGEGGMGSVWMAQQTEPVKRNVAVKLIKAGMDSKQVIARFEAERQALAVMDHPNIAKILDGGVADNGAPYFVMELVKGVPITKYCDAHKLTPRQRLELFVPVCQAIQHAHQKGIVHRDIKPSNVMVAPYDDRPVPKVIDFGVAKATGQLLTEQSLNIGFGGIVGTPEYMSPEQASLNNLDIDTRSDIYSLGVLLYELLAGSPPFKRKELEQAGLLEILRVIREEEPPRPSTRLSTADALPSLSANRGTEPKKLTGLLRNELDWIVMKALEKDRARRYETAAGFAADVQRYLAGEPVIAHPPSAGYRLRKFFSKHRGPVIVAGLVLFVLVAGMAGTSYGLIAARKAEARAVSEGEQKEIARWEAVANAEKARAGFAKAREAVDRSFTIVSENKLLSVPGLQPLRKELLEESLKFYREFAKRSAQDPTARGDLATALVRVASITADIGSKAKALEAYREAMRVGQELARERPDDPRSSDALATCHGNVALVLMELDRHSEALSEFEVCLRIREASLARNKGDARMEDELAEVRGKIALALLRLNRTDEAGAQLNQSLRHCRGRLQQKPGDAEWSHALAGNCNTLGSIESKKHRHREAVTAFTEAIEHQLRAVAAEPARADFQSWLGNHYFNLALVREMYLDERKEAIDARRKAVGVWEKLARDNPAVTNYRFVYAQGCVDLGNALCHVPDGEAPRPWYEKSRDLFAGLVRDHPQAARYHSGLGAALDGLAGRMLKDSPPADILPTLERAIQSQRKAIELQPDQDQYRRFLISHLTNAARIKNAAGDHDAIIALMREIVATEEWLVAHNPAESKRRTQIARSYHTIANSLEAMKQWSAAILERHKALAIARDVVVADPRNEDAIAVLSEGSQLMDRLLQKARQSKDAEKLWEETAAFWQKRLDASSADPRHVLEYAKACIGRGERAVDVRDADAALDWFQKARPLLEAAHRDRPNDTEIARQLSIMCKWIGDIHWVRDEKDRAVPAWQFAIGLIRDKLLPTDPKSTQWNHALGGLSHNLGLALDSEGKHPEALKLFEDAVRFQKIAYAADPSQKQWMGFHYQMLATTLRQLKRPADAAEVSRAGVALDPKDAERLIQGAEEIAQCIPLGTKEAGDQYAEEAVTLISEAMKCGVVDAKKLRTATFAPLAARDDFRQLLAEAEKKSLPPTVKP